MTNKEPVGYLKKNPTENLYSRISAGLKYLSRCTLYDLFLINHLYVRLLAAVLLCLWVLVSRWVWHQCVCGEGSGAAHTDQKHFPYSESKDSRVEVHSNQNNSFKFDNCFHVFFVHLSLKCQECIYRCTDKLKCIYLSQCENGLFLYQKQCGEISRSACVFKSSFYSLYFLRQAGYPD